MDGPHKGAKGLPMLRLQQQSSLDIALDLQAEPGESVLMGTLQGEVLIHPVMCRFRPRRTALKPCISPVGFAIELELPRMLGKGYPRQSEIAGEINSLCNGHVLTAVGKLGVKVVVNEL